MKRTVICLLSLWFFAVIDVSAQNTVNADATKYATEFFNSRKATSPIQKASARKKKSAGIYQAYQSSPAVNSPLYVFQDPSGGFVMIAQSNNTFKVVGYSDEAGFDAENIPPQLSALIASYEKSLQFYNPVPAEFSAGTPVVSPLLDEHGIKLNQFNHPEVGGSWTGCMATAVTQIMLFHAAEKGTTVKGYGSHCYNSATYGELCADFENSVYTSAELLSYHVAISMDMNFTTGASWPPTVDKLQNIEEFFRYFIKKTVNEDFYIKNELEHRRPVYANISGFPVGHAIVIDGYDNKGYYHLNFGWGGTFNGYFLMNNNSWLGTGNGGQKFNTNLESVYILSASPKPVNIQDSLALAAVHNALGGYEATGWDLTRPVWIWPGVLVMNDRVIRLSLNLATAPVNTQSIATEIGNLTALQELHIIGCLNGTIPPSISNLTALKELHIANNAVYIAPSLHKGNLKSPLPADIGNLAELERLSVSNALEGTLPASIGNLSKLKHLYIQNDTIYYGKGTLTGPIPPQIGNLKKLQGLYIINQQINGTIPPEIGNLTELKEINLSGNLLSGSIPPLTLPNLGYLTLNDNALTGISGDSWTCPSLINLDLHNNAITGAVPSYFSNFSELKHLNISQNQITSLPGEIGNLIQLETIRLDNNQLKALPDGLALNMYLKNLSSKNNRIEYVPANLGQSKSLESIDLSFNRITAIPEELGNNPGLNKIYLNDNLITAIPESFGYISDIAGVWLQNNEIQGAIPKNLMLGELGKDVRLNNNRFVFKDIPESSELRFGVRDQKPVALKKQLFKVQFGDTVSIDIRSLSHLAHPGNEYYWMKYPDFYSSQVKDDRIDEIEKSPVLTLVINEQNVKDVYYCKVFNPASPAFSFEYNGSTVTSPCMYYLNTDTISLQLATDVEIISDEYSTNYVTSLAALPDKTVSDETVTLVPPVKVKRGTVSWEASSDGNTWVKVSDQMARADLKANIKSISSNELVLKPRNNAYYRCCIEESGCDPVYSSNLFVKSIGKVIFDEVVNVTGQQRTIDVDSIQVVVPVHFHDADFRLTITKLENPPPFSGKVVAGSAYDVSVSFADTFEIPLLIKFKNIDKSKVLETETDRFEAVYFDDKDRKWKAFENARLSLKDSTLNILTNHLTKMQWWWYAEEYRSGFTDVYERNNILVFYKEKDEDFINLYNPNQSAQPWHVAGIPLMAQDITEYLSEVIAEYGFLGLPVPKGKFKVYIEDLNGEDGSVGILGMLQGYITIGMTIDSPVALRQAVAHEFMHYVQDDYIMAHGGNQFWLEVHASLSDRIVWNDKIIPLCESEEFLKNGLSSKVNYSFNILADSWDAWDLSMESNAYYTTFKTEETMQYYYTAGTFLHYMRSYRHETELLEPATLLKETSWYGSWRSYLAKYVSNHLNSVLGDEYEGFVKYLLSGANDKFTLVNKTGNPYAYLQDPKNKNVFNYPLTYRFAKGDNKVQTDNMEVKIPYMAAKVVLLENINPDTMVLVNYKRKHNTGNDHMVYYCQYDFQTKKMNFLDISDSAEYNFLIESRDKENISKKFKNYSFLLLINKAYLGEKSILQDFNASFELTAMPVLDIGNVALLSIYNGSSPISHSFSNGPNSILLGTMEPTFLENATGFTVRVENQSTSKKLVDKQTYQIQTQYTLVTDQGQTLGMPTMKDSTIYTQTIEHDVISGIFRISEREHKYHRLNTYIEFVAGTGGDVEERLVYTAYTDKVEDKNKTYWLTSIMNYLQPESSNAGYTDAFGKNIMRFETGNTPETQQVVSKVDGNVITRSYDKNGALVSETQSNYVSTDYSPAGLKVKLIFRVKK